MADSVDKPLFDQINAVLSQYGFEHPTETKFVRKAENLLLEISFEGIVRKTHIHLSPIFRITKIQNATKNQFLTNVALIGTYLGVDRAPQIGTYTTGKNRIEYALIFSDTMAALDKEIDLNANQLCKRLSDEVLINCGFQSNRAGGR